MVYQRFLKAGSSIWTRSNLLLQPIFLAAVFLLALHPGVRAEFVYVTATPSNCASVVDCGGDLNIDNNENSFLRVYNEMSAGNITSAVSLAPGKPTTPGARYFSSSFSNAVPDFGVQLSPPLTVTGAVYKVYHVFSSAAGNVSSNIILGFTNVSGCDLSFTTSEKFQSKYGVAVGGINPWQFLGYVTNYPDTSSPLIGIYYVGGVVDAGLQQRLLLDTFLFVDDACTDVPQPSILGSYITTDASVIVTNVDAAATSIKVYQYLDGAWTLIGEKTSGIVTNANTVTVSGLVKGGQLAATQTINGKEGCLWGVPTGIVVGSVNPRIRLALSLRETASTNVGGSGSTASGNIHFLGVTNRLSSAPGYPGRVLYPSNSVWQTVTFQRGPDFSNPVDPSIKWNSASGDPFAVGTLNCITSNYCVIDALAFAIDDLTSTGPFDIYLDTIQNGPVTFYTFENSIAGATDVGFRAPNFSGTTSGNLAGSPNSASVVNFAAYEGNKSIRLRFAYNGTANTKWVRLTASGVGNPVVDMNEPITIRFLFVPSGGLMPPVPTPPALSLNKLGDNSVLVWTGGHNLQSAPSLSDIFTNVPGVTLGPWTNTFSDPQRFFRLAN